MRTWRDRPPAQCPGMSVGEQRSGLKSGAAGAIYTESIRTPSKMLINAATSRARKVPDTARGRQKQVIVSEL